MMLKPLSLLMLAAVATPAADAASLAEKANTDQVEMVADDDPHMAQAFSRARQSLDTFLKLKRHPESHMQTFSVKVGVSDGDNTEYFWIQPFTFSDDRFTGMITNQPRLVTNVEAGQQIRFNRSDIVDWLYIDTARGRMVGNFTACAMLESAPPEEAEAFKRTYGLVCEE